MTRGEPAHPRIWPPGVESVLRELAPWNRPVLLTGPPGSGKSTLAREIHARSPRRSGPFEVMNCGAVPDTLFAAELFGSRSGAFTGAVNRPGKVAAARGGTLLLDEIGDLPTHAQAALTVFLDEGTYSAVGADRSEQADVRIIFATWRPLDMLRADLRDRIEAFQVALGPPDPLWVRELVWEWVRAFASAHNRPMLRIEPRVHERLVALVADGASLRTAKTRIERAFMAAHAAGATAIRAEHLVTTSDPDRNTLDAPTLLRHLDATGWNVTAAAKAAGVARSTFNARMARLGIRRRRG